MTTVHREIQSVSDLPAAIAAAETLMAKSVRARGLGTWKEVKPGGGGELCFGLSRILRVLRGGRRVRAVVDGEEITAEPWADAARHSRPTIILEIEF